MVSRVITGYAAVFGVFSTRLWSEKHGTFVERIRPGAFSRTLRARADVVALVNHVDQTLLGRTRDKSLLLRETARGLYFELDASDPESSAAWCVPRIGRIFHGMSFRFRGKKVLWDRDVYPKRCEILDADLEEISLVDSPAYENTSVRVVTRPSATPRRDRCARWLRLADAEMSISTIARTR